MATTVGYSRAAADETADFDDDSTDGSHLISMSEHSRLPPQQKQRQPAFLAINWISLLVTCIFLVFAQFVAPTDYGNWVLKISSSENFLFHNEPEKDTHVPTWGLFLFAAFCSGAILLFEWFFFRGTGLLPIVHRINLFLALWETVAFVTAVTVLGKKWVAEPRPDFIDRCIGLANFYNLTEPPQDPIVCRQNDSAVEEGRLSFPSGHASMSVCTGVFTTAYLMVAFAYRENVLSKLKPMWHLLASRLWFFVAIIPVLAAAGITASRVVDHRHSPADVTAGALLGFVLSLFLMAKTWLDLHEVGLA